MFPIVRNNFFCPPPPDYKNFPCEISSVGSVDLFQNNLLRNKYMIETTNQIFDRCNCNATVPATSYPGTGVGDIY
jgi:hypothetical protein